MERSEPIVVLIYEVEVGKCRHERLAGVLLITFTVIVNAVFEWFVGGCGISSLYCGLHV